MTTVLRIFYWSLFQSLLLQNKSHFSKNIKHFFVTLLCELAQAHDQTLFAKHLKFDAKQNVFSQLRKHRLSNMFRLRQAKNVLDLFKNVAQFPSKFCLSSNVCDVSNVKTFPDKQTANGQQTMFALFVQRKWLRCHKSLIVTPMPYLCFHGNIHRPCSLYILPRLITWEVPIIAHQAETNTKPRSLKLEFERPAVDFNSDN